MKKHVFHIRTYKKSPWIDVWIVKRDGAQDESLMHGTVHPDKLDGLLDLLDNLEGLVEIEREQSPWDGPTDEEVNEDAIPDRTSNASEAGATGGKGAAAGVVRVPCKAGRPGPKQDQPDSGQRGDLFEVRQEGEAAREEDW